MKNVHLQLDIAISNKSEFAIDPQSVTYNDSHVWEKYYTSIKYSGITWVSWHLISLATWQFIQPLVQAYNKEINSSILLALCEGNPQRARNAESFPCHDVTME